MKYLFKLIGVTEVFVLILLMMILILGEFDWADLLSFSIKLHAMTYTVVGGSFLILWIGLLKD